MMDNDEDVDKDKKIRLSQGEKAKKDGKYEIITNEEGETELILHDDEKDEPAADEEDADLSYELPDEYEEEDDVFGSLTADDIEEAMRIKKEEEREVREKVEELMGMADEALKSSRYSSAAEYIDQAEELSELSGEMCVMKLVALTAGFTDFSEAEKISDAARKVRKSADDGQKETLHKRYYKSVKAMADLDTGKIEELKAENEKAKAERREMLIPQRKKAARDFFITLGVFVVLAAVAIAFLSIMFSIEEMTYVIVAAVFSGAAVVTLIVMIVMARFYARAAGLCKLNEKDSSTKLGRELLGMTERFDAETACCEAMSPLFQDSSEEKK